MQWSVAIGNRLLSLLIGLTLLAVPAVAQPLPDSLWHLPSAERTAQGAPGPGYWQQDISYAIEATLDPDAKRLSGSVQLTYTNNAPDTLHTLWMQLEQNAFRPDSRAATQRDADERFGGAFDEGGYTLYEQRLTHGDTTYTPAATVDGTRMRIDLTSPLASGDSLHLTIPYTYTLPERGADRTGYTAVDDGHVFQIAQWYPRPYVYDDIRGWDPMPYLGQGEFYLHYGSFDVQITVPKSYVVASTGTLQNPDSVLTDTQRRRLVDAETARSPVSIITANEAGTPETRPAAPDSLTWHFTAHDVRDVVFAASDVFIWDATYADATTHNVLVSSFYPPSAQGERVEGWEAATRYLQHAVEHYSATWHPYPYDQAQHVAGPVRGMEYPQLSFASMTARGRGLFGIVDHELAHTYFPMLVGSNERRHAWLDEGLTTFLTLYSAAAFYGEPPRRRLQSLMRTVARGMQDPPSTSMLTPPDAMSRRELGFLAYRKPAAALHILREHILGPDRFDEALHTYIDRWAYKHPTPADFLRTLDDVADADLSTFWQQWFTSDATLDQAIADVSLDGRSPSFTLEHRGTIRLPMTVRLTFADGQTGTLQIPRDAFANTSTHRVRLPSTRQLVRIEIDPDGVLPDLDRTSLTWDAP